jgi:LmbE family N-acetylglucosaminyl deacetylase
MYRLLAVFAHPDDEAFGVGGTLAKYAAQDTYVTLICATRGEVGEIAPGTGATPETLGQVREGELRCAAQALGVRDLIFLGYRDSGMAGTPENDDPRSLHRADPQAVTPELVRWMRALKPHVVITFDPSGGYGHPDHLAVHRYTGAAFQAAGDPNRFPQAGAGWQPQRLFYTGFPRSLMREMREQAKQLGIDVSQFENQDLDWMGLSDDEITASIDVSPYLDAKWKALQCHQTQFGPDNLFRRIPESLLRQMMSREYFAQAQPFDLAEPRKPSGPAPVGKTTDLFDGL